MKWLVGAFKQVRGLLIAFLVATAGLVGTTYLSCNQQAAQAAEISAKVDHNTEQIKEMRRCAPRCD